VFGCCGGGFNEVLGREGCYNAGAMKVLRLVPLTFICDVHGFNLFAPMLMGLLVMVYLTRTRRALVPVTSSSFLAGVAG
jgi:uncharacterized membrane protein YesL